DIFLDTNAINILGDVTLNASGSIFESTVDGSTKIKTGGLISLVASQVGTAAANGELNIEEALAGAGLSVAPDVLNAVYLTSNGGLTIDDPNSIGLHIGGGIIKANSPLIINADATITADTTFTAAADGATAGDDLTVNSEATLTLDSATAIKLTLEAGDNIIFANTTDAAVNVAATAGQGAHVVVLSADLEGGGADAVIGDISQTTAAVTTIAETGDGTLGLKILGATVGALATPIKVDVDTFASNTTDALFLQDTDGVDINTVDATVGITTSGDDVRITTATTLSISDDIALGAGDLTLNAGGAVTQGATDTIIAAGLELLGTGPYTLTDSGNDVDNLAGNVTGAISFRDTDDFTLTTVGATSDLTSGSTITLNAGSGTVTQDANGEIFATGLALLGGGAFTLTQAGNDVDNLAGNTTGAISFRDTDNFAIDAVAGTNDLTSASTITLNAGSGTVTQTSNGEVFATGLALLGGGAYTLTQAGNDIGTLAANTNAISFRDTDDLAIDIVGATTGLTTSDDTVTLQTGTTLTLNEDINVGTGNLTLNAGGAVTQGAGDTIIAAGLELLGTGPYTLTDAGNDVNTIAINTTDAASFTDADGLTVGTVNTNGITTTGDNVSLTATTSSITIDDDISIGAGNLTLNGFDGSSQNAGDTISATGLLLQGGGAGSHTLTDTGNAITTLAANTTNAVSVTDSDGFSVGTVNAVDGVTASTVALVANTGNLTVTNTGAANDINATGGITLTASATDADVIINTTADVESAAGGVIINADNLDLSGTITASGQIVTLRPDDAGVAIDLGGADAAGTLGLTDAELDRVTATTLRIGKADSVAITISADVSPGAITNLHLINNNSVTGTAGGIVLAGGLAIEANGTVNFTDTTTDIDTLAIVTGGNAVSFVDADGFSVGTVDSVAGVGGTTVALTSTTGGITVTDTAAANDINATDAVTITLSGDDAVFTVDASADVETTANGVVVNADDMVLNGTIHATGQTITLRPRATSTDAIQLGANPATANTLELSDAELDNVFATTLVIGSSTAGALTIAADISPANITDLHLLNDNTVTGTAGGIVLAGGLAISSNGAINITDATTDVDTLAVLTSNDAITQFTDADALAIGSVNGVAGVSIGTADGRFTVGGITQTAAILADDLAITSTGAVTLTDATNDVNTLSISAATQTVQFTDADAFNVDDIQLAVGIVSAAATLIATTGDLTITNTAAGNDINATGAVTLTASGTNNDVIINATADVDTNAGSSVTINADNIQIAGTITATGQTVTLRPDDAGVLINIGGADAAGTLGLTDAELDLVAAGTIIAGRSNAGAITVSADVTTGATTLHLITGGAITGTAGGITETNLALEAAGTINFTDTTTAVTTLAVSNVGNSVTFTEADGFSVGTVDGITGVSGSAVTLTATTGNMTITDTAVANDINASGAVSLTVAGTDDTLIVSASAHIESTTGGVTLRTDELTLTGTVDANSSLVTIRPDANAQSVEIGSGAAEAGTLGITNTELDQITTSGGITIGSATQTGSITVVAGGADQTDGTPSITGGTFTLQNSTGAVNFNGTLTNGINTTVQTTSGDITFGAAGAITAAGQTVALTTTASGGGITGSTTALTNITATTVNLTAFDTIGLNGGTDTPIELAAQFISAAVTNTTEAAANDINISNTSASTVSITGMSARNASATEAIRYAQSGGGNLTIDGAITSGSAGTTGGDILISNPAGSVTLNALVSTVGNAGAGGTITLNGVVANVTPTVGAGDIIISGTSEDTIVTSDILNTDTVITLMANGDIIIQALLQTTDTDANLANDTITLIADNDNDGDGGVWIKDIGQIISAGDRT
ncbi:MAG: yapH, partial [Gammaproteobacteria bacterium]